MMSCEPQLSDGIESVARVCAWHEEGAKRVLRVRAGEGERGERTELQEVHAPAGIRGSVLVLKAKAAGALGAGFGRIGRIEPELEATRVRMICQGLHARRKSDGVGLDLVVCVARGRPTIVNRHSTTRAQQWARVSRWRVRLRGDFRGLSAALTHTAWTHSYPASRRPVDTKRSMVRISSVSLTLQANTFCGVGGKGGRQGGRKVIRAG